MKRLNNYKWTVLVSQVGVIVMTLLGWWLQYYSLCRYEENVKEADRLRIKFEDKFLDAQQSVNKELQTRLVDGFVKMEHRSDEQVLNGAKDVNRAVQLLYVGVITINLLGMASFWRWNRVLIRRSEGTAAS